MQTYRPSKRRRSSVSTATSRNGRSRAVSRSAPSLSNARSGSRLSAVSRRSSNETASEWGYHNQVPPGRTSSGRSALSGTASAAGLVQEDLRSIAATEPQQDEFAEDNDALHEIIMAVNLSERGSVGCAYYLAREVRKQTRSCPFVQEYH